MDKVHKFSRINKKYDDLFKDGLRKGKLPMRTTDHGFWGTVSNFTIFDFFNKIKLEKYNHLLDLGSGDGRVVLVASLFTQATGIEGDEELIKLSEDVKRELELDGSFHCDNFMKHDFSKYDCIFINPDKGFSKEFEEKLKEELEGDLFVYNQIYIPYSLEKQETHWFDQLPVTRYRGKDDS